MKIRTRKWFRTIFALAMCMVLMASDVSVLAEAAGEALSSLVSQLSATETGDTTGKEIKYSWSVDTVNYFIPGKTLLVHSYKASELVNADYGIEGAVAGTERTAEGAATFVNADFSEYTAFVIEFLGTSKTVDGWEGAEYYVDTVLDGSVAADEEMAKLQAKTDYYVADGSGKGYGFVLYIPTEQLDETNTPSRGDLIKSTFWHENVGERSIQSGHLHFYDNPAAEITYADSTKLNADVKLFNYDGTINSQGAGLVDTDGDGVADADGFVFWAGFWGLGGEVETVDGQGQENSPNDKGVYRYPSMSNELGADGYPQLSDGTSLGYLFDGTSTRGNGENKTSTLVAEMENGGGLFQRDENGYYYYDSLKNAAYYDETLDKFVLTDNLIVRPWYSANEGEDYVKDSSGNWVVDNAGGAVTSYGNFLPFNKVTTDNITVDGSVDWLVTEGAAYPAGSLESVGLIQAHAARVLAGSKALTASIKDTIDAANGSSVTTARLEEKIDFWFGMTVDFEFYMPEGGQLKGQDMTFEFLGDDDVFVYVGVWNEETKVYDYKLVLDIGGVHGARDASINFATGVVKDAPAPVNESSGRSEADLYSDSWQRETSLKEIFGLEGDTFHDYSKLSLKFFYLERGANISYCSLEFNMPTLPENSLTVSKELATDVTENSQLNEYLKDSYDYQFRVVKADADGKATDEPIIRSEVYDILENGVVVDTGLVGADGIFTLKAGQSAQFNNMLSRTENGDYKYIVQELIPIGLNGQYKEISYLLGSAGGSVINGTGETEFVTYETSALVADQAQKVVYRNTVDESKLSALKLTKMLAVGAEEKLGDQQYSLQVSLGGQLIPVGTPYTVGTETRTVTTAGVIVLNPGETAVIKGIVSGTEYQVKELGTADGNFQPTYSGTVSAAAETDVTVNITKNDASGELPLEGEAHVTVTNHEKESSGLELDKTVEETTDPDKFLLTLEAYATGLTSQISSTKPADIVLVVDQSSTMYTPQGADADRVYSTYQSGTNKGKPHIYSTNDEIPNEISGTDFYNMAYAADQALIADPTAAPEFLENAKHLGYYVAQHQVTGTWYIVQYAYDSAREAWGWYYVICTQTTRSVSVNTSVDPANLDWETEYGTVVYKPSAANKTLSCAEYEPFTTNFIYYKSQYAALYDSLKVFVQNLKEQSEKTKVDHRVAVVGFSSPFYDAWDNYDGTGLYIDGQYYLYDTDYLYKGKYVNGVLQRDDANGTVILDPDEGSKGSVFVAVEADESEWNRPGIVVSRDESGNPTDTMYDEALVSVKDNSTSIFNSIEAIRANYQQTCPAVGIEIAQNIFAARDAETTENRDKIVVIFTDGVPTLISSTNRVDGFSQDYVVKEKTWTIDAGKADAINKAKQAKDEGVQIYTIGTSDLVFTDKFLEYVSSEYPTATATYTVSAVTDSSGTITGATHKYSVDYGTKASDAYSSIASTGTDITLAFGNIVSSVTSTSIDLDGSAVLMEVLSDYFDLSIVDISEIKVYTADYLGDGLWADRVLTDLVPTLTSSIDGGRVDTVNVTGFSYKDNYVADAVDGASARGKKLIVVIPIETRSGFWGGNNVPTNKDTTAIYKDTTVVDVFPIPEANVPIRIDILAKDKTIYYDGDVTARELIDSVTAGGLAVTINPDGTFDPQEDWMSAYADLAWAKDSTTVGTRIDNHDPEDYTYEIVAIPKYDGTENPDPTYSNIAGEPTGVDENGNRVGVTDSDTAHVYILVPELTFEDSTILIGYQPDKNYHDSTNKVGEVVWVNMEADGPTEATDEGSEPELTLTYTAADSTFADDTPVNVTISGTTDAGATSTDFTDVTTFKWVTCDEKLHSSADHGTIETHKGSVDAYEFWIHVPDGILPDVIVIDYGLPVNIDVLFNDPIYQPVLVALGVLPAEGEAASLTFENEIGTATVLDSQLVQYVLGSMQMNKEEVIKYFVKSENTDTVYESTVTIIPATTIYYEDGFVSYSVYDNSSDELIKPEDNADVQWTAVPGLIEKTQGQDRPKEDAEDALGALDADNIYGYDGAYTGLNTYSMGSAMMVTVDKDRYAMAEFTFWGTGFDLISMTGGNTGTILVDVFKADEYAENGYNATPVEYHMVDTYYGYKWAQTDTNNNGEIDTEDAYSWVADTGSAAALYQVPVIKVNGLTYGKYTAVVTVSYFKGFDHGQNGGNGSYEFYLDAVRIYDPANDGKNTDGTINSTVQGAYTDDKEGWPEYFELRNLVISRQDFDSLDDEEGSTGIGGAVFIDNTANEDGTQVPTISDYTNYGPNNELYLAPGQAVAFDLNVEGDIAAIHLALKSVGQGTAKIKYYGIAEGVTVDAEGTEVNASEMKLTEIATATDLYYAITALNNKTVVIANDSTSTAILSVTNIKVTYTSEHTDYLEDGMVSIKVLSARLALDSLMTRSEIQEPEIGESETTAPEGSDAEDAETETTAPEGSDAETETTAPEGSDAEDAESETTTPEDGDVGAAVGGVASGDQGVSRFVMTGLMAAVVLLAGFYDRRRKA